MISFRTLQPIQRHAPGRKDFCSFAVILVIALAQAACGSGDPVAEARELHAKREFEASLEPLREHIESARDDAEAQYLYGVALTSLGRLTEAVWPLRRASENPEWATPATIQLASISVLTTDWPMAIELLDGLLEREPENVQALALRGYARTQSRMDYEGALADADAVLATDPAHSDALVIRGVALLGLGRIDEAGEAIEAASEHFDGAGLGLAGSPRFCIVRATFSKEKGELETAEEIFEDCLERFPVQFIVIDEAARFFDAMGRPDRSLEMLRVAYEALPGARNYRMSLVFRLGLQGDHDEAERILIEATRVAKPAASAAAMSDLAAYYFEQDRLDDAIAKFEEALVLVPEPGASFMFAFADTLVAAGEYERALELADEMNLLSHRELVRGRVAFERGEPEKALLHLEQGLRLWPANAVARYFAALAAEQTGDFDRAIEEYRYSIRSAAGSSDARLRLGRLLVATRQPMVALEAIRHSSDVPGIDVLERALLELELLSMLALKNVLEEVPLTVIRRPENWAEAVAARARGLRRRGKPQAAADEVLRADRLNLSAPGNAPALESLVLDLVTLGRANEALGRVDAALAKRGDYAQFHAIRGLVIASTAVDSQQSRPAFERAIELDPENATALLGLARAYARAGDTDAAIAHFERAAAADEGDTDALREAADLLLAAGRQDEATQRIDALLERDPYAGDEALRLAKIMLEGDGSPPDRKRLLVLLRTAAYFEKSEEAIALLDAWSAAPTQTGSGDEVARP